MRDSVASPAADLQCFAHSAAAGGCESSGDVLGNVCVAIVADGSAMWVICPPFSIENEPLEVQREPLNVIFGALGSFLEPGATYGMTWGSLG